MFTGLLNRTPEKPADLVVFGNVPGNDCAIKPAVYFGLQAKRCNLSRDQRSPTLAPAYAAPGFITFRIVCVCSIPPT